MICLDGGEDFGGLNLYLGIYLSFQKIERIT